MSSEFEKKFDKRPSFRMIKKHFKHRSFLWPFHIMKLRKRYPNVGLKPKSKIKGFVQIGNYTYFLGFVTILTYCDKEISEPGITIGKFCSIGSNVYISSGIDFHYTHLVSTYPMRSLNNKSSSCIEDHYKMNRIIIGNDVWMGASVKIIGNVSIGNGSIIGRDSVVTKDVLPYHMAAGNPATIKKKRFPDETIEQLEEISWWDWPLDKIKRNHTFFNIDLKKNDKIILKEHIID